MHYGAILQNLASRPQQSNPHPPALLNCPTLAALPGGVTGLLTSLLAGVVTEEPLQGGEGGSRSQEDPGQLLTS